MFQIINDWYARDEKFGYSYSPKTNREVPRSQDQFVEIAGSDGPTFEAFGQYARDARNVYFGGCILEKAAPASFQYLGVGFAKDREHGFCNGQQIVSADVATLRLIDDGARFARDRHSVYLNQGKAVVVQGADPGTFVLLRNSGFGRDRRAIYYLESEVEGADPDTFALLTTDPADFAGEHGYARDRNCVYFRGKIIRGANPATFEPLRTDLSRDHQSVFFRDEPLACADRATFLVLAPQKHVGQHRYATLGDGIGDFWADAEDRRYFYAITSGGLEKKEK